MVIPTISESSDSNDNEPWVHLIDKIDEQTEEFKEKVEEIKDIFIDGVKLSTDALVSSHDSLKRKIEDQAEEITSLKRKMSKMDNKLDDVLKLLSR